MLRRATHTTTLRRAISPGVTVNIMPKRKSVAGEESAGEPARRRSGRLQKSEDVPKPVEVSARKRVKATKEEVEVEEVHSPAHLRHPLNTACLAH